MKAVSVLSLTERRGAPRLWVESFATERAGFQPGVRFVVEPYGKGILFRVCEAGTHVVTPKQRKSKVTPVIDLNNRSELAPLSGHSAARVVFGEKMIYVSPLASETRRLRRLARMQRHLADGFLELGGIAVGGGIASHALHAGLADTGVDARSVFANEVRADLANHSMEVNDVFGNQTIMCNLPVEELAYDDEVSRRLPELDVLELGLPCSAASAAGRAKTGIALPEDHSLVGYLVAPAIALIAKLNPVAILFENVELYSKSASASILRGQLQAFGYDVHEVVALGTDWGELEARKRWFLIAMTKGIKLDIGEFKPEQSRVRVLSEIMDSVADDDPAWSSMQYLKDKEMRDKQAGKGFRMQIYTGAENAIATLTKGIAKRRSTDPFFQHPSKPDLLRLPSVREHAAVKGIPVHLVSGLSQTVGHEVLGQSIVYAPVRALAKLVGSALLRHASTTFAPIHIERTSVAA